ncbi:hypothetical protein H4R35_005947 [Dimargaris xerosporica]|nr:hypothetical protein H4R35_005947 [Dimargaris xerosporica]
MPMVEQISPYVFRILGLNPGKFTLQGTNTYLIGTGSKRILLDTGEGKPGYMPLLEAALSHLGNVQISHVLLTHWHRDHSGGLGALFDRCREQPAKFTELPEVWKRHCPEHDAKAIHALLKTPIQINHIPHGMIFKVDGATLRAIHTPGHTSDHTAFYFEEENAIFSGDCVIGQGSVVFEDLHQYIRSLKVLRSFNGGRIYPGHGPIIEDGCTTLDSYIRHRMDREEEILHVLSTRPTTHFAPHEHEDDADSDDGATAAMRAASAFYLHYHQQTATGSPGSGSIAWAARDLVRVIYAKYPKSLYDAAESSVLLHLAKLQAEDKVFSVQADGVTYWSLAPKRPL